jgi:6-phosphogluconolactonase
MLIASLMSALPSVAAPNVPIYIGTYTSEQGSKGIYRTTLNLENGSLSQPVLAAEGVGPSYVAVHPSRKLLFAAHEGNQGEASSYAIQADGSLKKLSTQTFPGQWTCHIAVSPSGKHVFAATYGQGYVVSLPIGEDGALGKPITVFQNQGSGPDRSRQEGPHAHFVAGLGAFAYSCDLGTDEVLIFRYDSATGTLALTEPRAGKVPPGGGPRHWAATPNGLYLYANNEMTCAVTAFRRDPTTGALKAQETLPTLPEGTSVTGNSTAAIEVHPSGKFLYVSNRGHNSVAVFAIGGDGRLTRVEIAPAQVRTPRDFSIDPSGKWLVIAGQDSDDVTTLAIDASTGKLSPTGHRISVSKAVCVAFAP